MNIKKTADLFINFAIKRLAEILGITVFITGLALLLALASYSPEDPNFIFPDSTNIKNLLGFNGSFISDLFFQSIGLISPKILYENNETQFLCKLLPTPIDLTIALLSVLTTSVFVIVIRKYYAVNVVSFLNSRITYPETP